MNRSKSAILVILIASIGLGLTGISVALAQNTPPAGLPPSAGTDKTAKTAERKAEVLDKKMTQARDKADKEIDRRLASLTKLSGRLDQLRNISSADKASINTVINGLTASLSSLKNEIDLTSSSTVLKADLEAITQNYRVYALVMPQLMIVASADRILVMVNMMAQIGAKLETRLAGETNNPDIASLQSTLADFKSKIIDAKSQAEAALSGVATLVPDQGDKTKMEANTAALKAARAKVKDAQDGLKAARKDGQTVIKSLVKTDQAIMKSSNASSTNATSTRKSSRE